VNTVSDLRRALSDEVTRLQAPPGLEIRVLQQALRDSASAAAPPRTRRRRSEPDDRPRVRRDLSLPSRWIAGFVAMLLAIAVIGGLLVSRGLHPTSQASPRMGLPAHGRIAFTMQFGPSGCGSAGHLCDYGNIFSIEPNGTGLRKLTDLATGLDQDPAWSPTSDRIVFDVQFPVGTGLYEATSSNLFSMDANGGTVHQLTSEPSGIFDAGPVISPDGARIAFERFDLSGNLTGIWLMNADGTNIVRVTATPSSAAGGDQNPDFSPDGTRLVFDRDQTDGGNGTIYIVSLDGKGLTQVTPTSLESTRPRWSPDGSRIVFAARSATNYGNIFVVNSDGTGLIALTHLTFPAYAAWPSWSPDGKMIVYDSYTETDNVALAVMDADGSHPTVIWRRERSTNFFAGTASWGTAP
jgi:WD40-like Beta Propeller Repeat